MLSSVISLPQELERVVSELLGSQSTKEWLKRTLALHNRYMEQDKNERFVRDFDDALAYLAMRVPATYAQTLGAFSSVSEAMPSFMPKTMLDIGCGPGTALWAAKEIWLSLTEAICVDQDKNLLTLGKQLSLSISNSVEINWQQKDITKGVDNNNKYDLVVLGNVLGELSVSEGEKVLGQAFNACNGVLVVIEPGTPFGSSIVESVAGKLASAGYLIAPYIDNSFVRRNNFWLHFSQKFTRPEFQRRVRQNMRDSVLMASDIEDAKYSYVAISKIPSTLKIWGRCVGPTEKQKGFLEVPILTKEKIEKIKVMKRNKEQYNVAKELKWGQIIQPLLQFHEALQH